MKVLLALAHPLFFRNFRSVIEILLERGHAVHVRFCREHKTLPPDRFDILRDPPAGLSWSLGDDRLPEGSGSRASVRGWRDVLHSLRPEFRHSDVSWERLRSNYKETLPAWALRRGILHRLLERGPIRAGLAWLAAARDRSFPAEGWAMEVLERERPDLVLASPAVTFKSSDVEYLNAARRRGIPCAVPVASWDNLTNKGVIKVRPDAMIVWNDAMRREAIELHGMPPEHVDVVGAPLFDEWFRRQPTVSRDEFLTARGLDPARKTVLYTCSSFSIAGPKEIKTILQWHSRLQHAGLEVNVLVRPHPMAVTGWQGEESAEAERAGLVVWPAAPQHPIDEATRAEFFDSLYHADAVVGLNTSAMIEAAILGRPVLCFRDVRRAQQQTATLHFQHLLRGDFLRFDETIKAHVEHLRAVLDEAPGETEARCRRFVEQFVRPGGLDREAAPLMVDAIERRFQRNPASYTGG